MKFPSRSEDPKDKPSAISHVFQMMMKDSLFATVLAVHQVCDGLVVTLISNPCQKYACVRRIYSGEYPITVISFKLDGLILGCGRNSAELMHYVFSNQAILLENCPLGMKVSILLHFQPKYELQCIVQDITHALLRKTSQLLPQ